MRPEYGPTLGRLLAPRWHASSRAVRATVMAAGTLSLLAVLGLVLTLQSAHYSHGGRVAFGFAYKGLYRVRAPAGAYVKVDARSGDGALKYSYTVSPLSLPAYAGSVSGALPVYAAAYVALLKARDADFVLRGEGKTRVNTVVGYQVLYTTSVEGREMFGRDVLLVPPREGAREGVAIAMLTSPTATSQVKAPIEVASAGILLRPLKTFTFQ